MDTDDIKAEVARAFADAPRPAHFTNYKHCEECAEHDATLNRFTPDTITTEELGNPGWDPICFATPEAFCYYFPALARLAMDSSDGPDSYLDSFLFHVLYEGETSRFFRHFTRPQRAATLNVLRFLRAEKSREIDTWALRDELDDAIALWTRLVDET